MITLDTSEGVLTLPHECIWLDEFEWNKVKARNFYSITGDMIVEKSYVEVGRPITLGGDNAIIKRSDLLTLMEYTDIESISMTLTLHDSRVFNVMFRYWDQPVVEGNAPIQGYSVPDEDHYYILTLKLVTL